MSTSDEGKVHEAKKFLEVCADFGYMMDLIYEGLNYYVQNKETQDLQEYEKLYLMFTTSIPALKEQLDFFNSEFIKACKILQVTFDNK